MASGISRNERVRLSPGEGSLAVDYDVAVIGAGPAGAWTAYCLASRGARVAVIDGSHPREKPCGGGVTGRAFSLVQRALGSPPLPVVPADTATFAASSGTAVVALSTELERNHGLGIVSRRAFDAALLDAAHHAGAEHIPRRVTALERSSSGWTIVTASGRATSHWLIGADGANSFVRRHVSSPFPRAELSVATGYFVHGATSTDVAVDFENTPTGYVWSFPRTDHLAVGACGQADAVSAQSLLHRAGQWIQTSVPRYTRLERYSWPIPSLSARALAREQPAGDRWMLVGDAAGLVDPITREGIYFGLLSGEYAAASLHGASHSTDYSTRVRETIFDELARAARLKAGFFRPELLALLVRALNRSGRVRAIMADLVAGRQPYKGLRRRLLATFEWRLMFELFRL